MYSSYFLKGLFNTKSGLSVSSNRSLYKKLNYIQKPKTSHLFMFSSMNWVSTLPVLTW